MVKFIATKRNTKTLKVNDYWKIREQIKDENQNNKKQKKKPIYIDLSRRHRFKTNSQKRQEIDINIGHRVDELNQNPYSISQDEIGSFFLDELETTRSITKNQQFRIFLEEIVDISQNLPMILHNINQIITIILKYLKDQKSEKFILDMLPSLIRDCQHYLYKPFVEQIFLELLNKLNIQNLEIVEQVYNVLAHALKYFFSEIVKNFAGFYKIYEESLFSHSNKYIRQFSADSFSYILKKMKQIDQRLAIDCILKSLFDKSDSYIMCISNLVYQTMHGMGRFLNHHSIDIFKNLWESILNQYNQQENCLKMIVELFKILCKSISAKDFQDKLVFNFNDIFTTFSDIFSNFIQLETKEEKVIDHNIVFTSILNIIKNLSIYSQGEKLDEQNISKISELLLIIIKNTSNDNQLIQIKLAQTLGTLYKFSFDRFSGIIFADKIQQYIIEPKDIEVAFNFISYLIKPQQIEQSLSLQQINLYQDQEEIVQSYNLSDQLAHICLIQSQKFINKQILINDDKECLYAICLIYFINLIIKYSQKDLQKQNLQLNNLQAEIENQILIQFKNIFEQLLDQEIINNIQAQRIIATIKTYQFFDLSEEFNSKLIEVNIEILQKINDQTKIEEQQVFKKIIEYNENTQFYKDQEQHCQQEQLFSKLQTLSKLNKSDIILIIKGEIFCYLSKKLNTNNIQKEQLSKLLQQEMKILTKNQSSITLQNPFFLEKLLILFQSVEQIFSLQDNMILFELLQKNLKSKYHEVRLYSLKILSYFQTMHFIEPKSDIDKESTYQGECKIIQILINIEEQTPSLQTEREIKVNISKIISMIDTQRIPDLYMQLLILYFCGYAFTKLALLQNIIKEALQHCLSQNNKFNQVFFLFLEQIKLYNYKLYYYNNEDNAQTQQCINQDNIVQNQIINDNNQEEDSIKSQLINLLDILFYEEYFFTGSALDEHLALEIMLESLIKSHKVCNDYQIILKKLIKDFFDFELYSNSEKICDEQINSSVDIFKLDQSNLQLKYQSLWNVVILVNQREKKFANSIYFYKKIELMLKLFTVFSNVSIENQTEKQFFSIFVDLLRKDNQQIQNLALDCLVKFQLQEINQYQQNLKNLISFKTFRDEIVKFNLSQDSQVIEHSHRKELIPIVISIAYTKLFSRKGLKHKKQLILQRNTIYNFFSSMNIQDFEHFIQQIMKNYTISKDLFEYFQDSSQSIIQLAFISFSKLNGFLTNLKNMIDKMSQQLYPFVCQISNVLLNILQFCQLFKANLKSTSPQDQHYFQKLKETNKMCMQRLCDIYKKYLNEKLMKDVTFNLVNIMNIKIENLQQQSVSSTPGILKIFAVWAEFKYYHNYYQQYPLLLKNIIKIYSMPKVQQIVIQMVHKIIMNLGYMVQQSLDEIQNTEQQEYEDKNQIEQQKQANIINIFINQGSLIQNILENLHYYLAQNLNPKLISKKGQKQKVDLNALTIIENLSSYLKDQSEIVENLLSYFIQFTSSIILKNLSDTLENTKPLNRNAQQNSRQQVNKALTIIQILSIICNLLKLSSNSQLYYHNLTYLLPYAKDQQVKQLLVQCIEQTDYQQQNISLEVIEMLKKMSTYQKSIERTLDYDIVIQQCYNFNTQNLNNLDNFQNQQLILLNYLSLVDDEELSLRLAVQSGFQTFFQLITTLIDQAEPQKIINIRKFITERYLPFIQLGLKKIFSFSESVYKTFVKLFEIYLCNMQKIDSEQLSKLFLSSSSNISYLELGILQNNSDQNLSFFENICDIQMAKRIKAVNNLNRLLNQENNKLTDCQQEIKKIIFPILEYTIFNKCQEIKANNKIKITQVTESHYNSLSLICIECYGLLCKNLGWSAIKKLLKKFTSFLTSDKHDEKVVVKLISSILDHMKALPLESIIAQVEREMKENKQIISQQGIMQELLKYTNSIQTTVEGTSEGIEKSQQQQSLQEEKTLSDEEKKDRKISIDEDEIADNKRKVFSLKNQISLEKNLANLNEGFSQENQLYGSIYKFLRISVLFPLKSLLMQSYAPAQKNETQDEKIRVYLTVAIIKLLTKFPKDIFRIEFPRIISRITRVLKSKNHDTREQARKALTEVVKITGPYFFHYILKELQFHLNQGWDFHVLNYTVFVLINTLINDMAVENGSLDYCVENLINLLIKEIFGDLTEEKSLDIGTKYPEVKKFKAFQCFHLLCKVINFENSIVGVVAFLKEQMVKHLDSEKNYNKFDELQHHILEGFAKNNSVRPNTLTLITFTLIRDAKEFIENSKKIDYLIDTTKNEKDNLPEKQDLIKHNLAKTFLIDDDAAQNKSIFKSIQNRKNKNLFKIGCCLSNFGLRLSLMGLKSNIFNKGLLDDQNLKEQFESLIKLVLSCLDSNDNTMITNSLKFVRSIIDWPLKIIKKNKKNIINSILDIIKKLTLTDIDMIQETFSILRAVFEKFDPNCFNSLQIKAIIEYIQMFSEASDYCTEPLQALKTLIDKKVIHPNIFDIINKIREKMITSYNRSVQKICKTIFIAFLVNFPLSEKLMQSNINFLIKNTEYQGEGRIIVFEVIKVIIDKFPTNIIEFFGEILFITFVVGYQKENDKENQTQIQSLQTLLLSKISIEKQKNLFNNTLAWLKENQKIKIQCSSYQALRLFLPLKHVSFEPHIQQIKQHITVNFEKSFKDLCQFRSELREKKLIKYSLKNSAWTTVLEGEQVEIIKNSILNSQSILLSILNFLIELSEHNFELFKSIIVNQQQIKKLKKQSIDLNNNQKQKQIDINGKNKQQDPLIYDNKVQKVTSNQEEQKIDVNKEVNDVVVDDEEEDDDDISLEETNNQHKEEYFLDKCADHKLLCLLIQFVMYPNQTISNAAVKILNILLKKCSIVLQEIYQKCSDVVDKLISKIVYHLYFSKISSNIVIEETIYQHQLIIQMLDFFCQCDKTDISQTILLNLQKCFQRSLGQIDKHMTIIDILIDLYQNLIKELTQMGPENQLKHILTTNELWISYVLTPIVKIKNQDEYFKQTNPQALDKCEQVIENMKQIIELNKFFSFYSNVRSKLQAIKLEKKQEEKLLAVIDPATTAQNKKDKNLKKKRHAKNKLKKIKGASTRKQIKHD